MGTVRFLLAFSVVLYHAGSTYSLTGGRVSVQIFYLISGYLISFILNSQVEYKRSRTSFYLNRALRIYPIYFTMAIISALLILVQGSKLRELQTLPIDAIALLTTVNVLIFGQDAVEFLHVARHLQFGPGGLEPQLWHFLLLPQAWTLSLELSFYALSPFIVRSLWRTAFFMLLSAGSMLTYILLGGSMHDPWSYRFFPFELSLFLVGSFSEQFTRKLWLTKPSSIPLTTLAIMFVLFYPVVMPFEPFTSIFYIIAFAFFMPSLFAFQNGRRWDVFIGDLSYPLYICHWPIVGSVKALSLRYLALQKLPTVVISIVISIAVAVLLERCVSQPVERLRRTIRKQRAPLDHLQVAVVP